MIVGDKMSVILMSIKPKYVDKIFNGNKKYEYRKKITKKQIDKIIVYSSSPIKKIVGELIIKQVLYDKKNIIWKKTNKSGGINKNEYDKYYCNCDYAVAYEIEKTVRYSRPKNLSDYKVKTAPQSYIYIR